ncbi:hypothetical protein [Candidatus Poriferisodalis sp.]|uniref:hypothetical protein n=1 Tax=Candidatus Poriferisodalis sp. TaxID=3101277 RepID=UPI003C6F8D50
MTLVALTAVHAPTLRKISLGALRYRDASHASIPHVVSFSGGRSSAALAFMAAEEGLLRPERRDVVLFANTSAEHPGTYEFAAECTSRLELEFGLPCFWFEFCTVEDAWRGDYHRKASYRLVKPVPLEDDPDGYRSRGELFEEMVSLQGMLPNPHSRTCTAKLKLYPSHELLAEWLGGTAGPAHSGHHWSPHRCATPGCEPSTDDVEGATVAGLVDPERVARRYIRNGGMASLESVRQRAAFLATHPPARPQQYWANFTVAPVPAVREGAKPAPMRGPNAAQHVRLLGLRADETGRVDRVLSRTLYAEGATTAACTVKTQPPGERPYFPLHDSGVGKDDVADYWAQRDFDLDIPTGAGNCVFCFMKGTRQLSELVTTPDFRRRLDTPTDVSWWVGFEQRHARVIPRRGGGGTSRFGFFGVNKASFQEVALGRPPQDDRYASGTPACDCTD